MTGEKYLELREQTGAIIKHLKECLRAAAELDGVIFRLSCSSIDGSRVLVASFSKMHDLVHNADVQISKAGQRLINEAALSELHEQTKKGAA